MSRTRGRIGFGAGVAVAGLVVGGAAALSGCSSSAHASGTSCGTTRTGAGVPVIVKVVKGNVACGTAVSVENAYAAKIRTGQVQGNGGGAPVTVSGWICQGYPTPELLRTGDASECHAGGAEILAVLPSPPATPSAG